MLELLKTEDHTEQSGGGGADASTSVPATNAEESVTVEIAPVEVTEQPITKKKKN